MTTYYWDFIKIYYKILLVFILQYFDQWHISKGCLCIIVMLVYILIFTKKAPIVKIQYAKLEENSQYACIATIALTVNFY